MFHYNVILLYTNLNSSIICCLFSGDIHLSFGFSILSSFCECNSLGDFFETLVILPAILLPIKSPVASAVFRIAFFEAVFIASFVDFLAISRYQEAFDYTYCACF